LDFSFTEEQQLLLDSIRRYVGDHYSFDQRKAILAAADGYSRRVWKDFADLGLLGLNVPDALGGMGGGAVDTLLMASALGEGLVVEPYLSSAVLATRAIAALGTQELQESWLPRLAAGEGIAVLVHDLLPSGKAGYPVRAKPEGEGWSLSGRVSVVYHAPLADLLLVAASTHSDGRRPDALFAIAGAAKGLNLNGCFTVDAQVAADVELDAVSVDAASRVGGDATGALAATVDFGLLALCAETLGVLDKCLALTVDYTRTRHQFGGPIGRFQALQHRMVDMLTRIEQARSLVFLAASRCEGADVAARESALSAAKVLVSDAARFVGQQAVQLHGGMGVADEMSVSHYFKRLLAAELRFGGGDAHLDRYADHLSNP
jgi:alkylation response protein AidB-like acyl-CoA dehydrogenase